MIAVRADAAQMLFSPAFPRGGERALGAKRLADLFRRRLRNGRNGIIVNGSNYGACDLRSRPSWTARDFGPPPHTGTR